MAPHSSIIPPEAIAFMADHAPTSWLAWMRTMARVVIEKSPSSLR
jgi:hypothetical protein